MKKVKSEIQQNFPIEPRVRYVKAARAWVRVTWTKGKQSYEWFVDDPRTSKKDGE